MRCAAGLACIALYVILTMTSHRTIDAHGLASSLLGYATVED